MKSKVEIKAKSANIATLTVPTSSVSAPSRRVTRSDIALSAEGFPLLGYCIFWSIKGVKVPCADFANLLMDCGIDATLAPNTRQSTALKRAMESLNPNASKFTKKVAEDRNRAVFANGSSQVVDSQSDMPEIEFVTGATASLRKHTNELKINASPEEEQQIRDLFATFKGNYNSVQIRKTILDFLQINGHAVTVRDDGGLYFIPSTNLDQLVQAESLCKRLEKYGKASITRIPIIDSEGAADSMWQAMVAEAETALTKMQQNIDSLEKEPTAKGQQSRLKEMQDLRAKISMYGTLLDGTAKNLTKKLENLERSFLRKVDDLAKKEALEKSSDKK